MLTPNLISTLSPTLIRQAIGEDQEHRAFIYVVDTFNNTYEDNQGDLTEALNDALKKIDTSTSPKERTDIVEALDKKVDKLIEKMDKVGVIADDALENELYDEDKVAKVEKIKKETEEYPDKIRKYVKDKLDEALKNAGTHDQTPCDELLKIYHKFSVGVDTIGARMPAQDEGIPEDAAGVRSRLARIVGQMEMLYEMEKNLRATVHGEIDTVFEEESLLGDKWDKDGDRYQWEYPEKGDRTLKLVPTAEVERYGAFESKPTSPRAPHSP